MLATVSLVALQSLPASAVAECEQEPPGVLQDLMTSELYGQTVFANTYVSAGAGAGDQTVNGSVLANTYVTTGAGSTVTGNIHTGTILTIGASGTVLGDTLAATASTLGAGASVEGKLHSGTAVTLGAGSNVKGLLQYGTTVTTGAGAISESQANSTAAVVVADLHQDVLDAQAALDAMPNDVMLVPGDIATDITFEPGVYDVPGLLTVTANKTITLDARDKSDSVFIFNVGNYLTFGAGVEVVVINAPENDNTRVIWNATGGYVSVGANANIVGTILAKEYVSTGADSSITGAGDTCGAVYSSMSYVSIGAGASIGSGGTCGGPAVPVCVDEDYGDAKPLDVGYDSNYDMGIAP
ncbi:MAG: putative acyltransferase (DUF342 family) [Cognaticolwellia sp.]|jgi:predicted acyltransferase (DUF342 family)